MFNLAIPGGFPHTQKPCYNKDRKRVAKSDQQVSEKFKRLRKGELPLRTQKEVALERQKVFHRKQEDYKYPPPGNHKLK